MDGIVYINLAHRVDRKNSIEKNLIRYGFDMKKIHRIDAVLNELCGHIGCGESHIKALEMAIENNWEYVLILEDDFLFAKKKEYVHDTLEKLKNITWDVVLLVTYCKPNIKSSEYPFLKKIITCTGAIGYIVRRHYYQKLINNFKEAVAIMKNQLDDHIKKCLENKTKITKLVYCNGAIDQHWFQLQHQDTFYLCNPYLGSCCNMYSDNNCSIEFQKNRIK